MTSYSQYAAHCLACRRLLLLKKRVWAFQLSRHLRNCDRRKERHLKSAYLMDNLNMKSHGR